MPHEEPAGALVFVVAFNDPVAVAKYAEGPRRYVQGFTASPAA